MPQLIAFPNKYSARFLALACTLAFFAVPAQADLNCSTPGIPNIDFGDVNVFSGTYPQAQQSMTITCTKTAGDLNQDSRLCLYIGDGAAALGIGPGGPNKYTPRILRNGSDAAGFQIYKDTARSVFWGTTAYPSHYTGPRDRHAYTTNPYSFSETVVLYLEMKAFTTAINGTTGLATIPQGTYTNDFSGVHTVLKPSFRSISLAIDSNCDPQGTANNSTFPFTVQANVKHQCEFHPDAIGDINFGTHSGTASNLSGSTSFKMRCSRRTPYLIGLLPRNANVNGAGVMYLGADKLAPDPVPYQLYRPTIPAGNIKSTNPWGNTGTQPISPGNGVTKSGTGAYETHTIFATVPTANAPVGSYEDTVTINVNY